jgi:predicted RNA binding protein YcfA (HicA-like mRNA interferase family)
LPKLPVVTGAEMVKALRHAGSHVVLTHPKTGHTVSVPVHGGQDLPRGTLAGILRDSGLTREELRRLLG